MSRLASTTLRIGELAPPFALPGLDGEVVELAEARGICGVLALFTPGAWSPATRRQLGEINAVYEQLRASGVQVVVLMTQSAKALKDRLAPYAIPFPILADERREAARDYGVFRAISLDGLGVTRPAAFMIDRDGVIRFVYVGQRDTDIPDTESLVKLATWLIGVAPIEEQEPVAEPEIEAEAEAGEAAVEGEPGELEVVATDGEAGELEPVAAAHEPDLDGATPSDEELGEAPTTVLVPVGAEAEAIDEASASDDGELLVDADIPLGVGNDGASDDGGEPIDDEELTVAGAPERPDRAQG